eukprot:GHRQ01028877.1.p1 GENE.GHRQ01028877.1~~GHRQ01028877.1.p1  ORF type:complete len:159 (-),score=44.61 GHRQ01028877.1:30-506(-)
MLFTCSTAALQVLSAWFAPRVHSTTINSHSLCLFLRLCCLSRHVQVCNMLTMREMNKRMGGGKVLFSSLYPGCIAETGLFRNHVPVFKKLFPVFQKYVTKGYVSEEEAGKRLAQVCYLTLLHCVLHVVMAVIDQTCCRVMGQRRMSAAAVHSHWICLL